MKEKFAPFGIVLGLVFAVCGEAKSDLVTFHYQGRVTHTQFSGVSVGELFTATVTIDTTFVLLLDPIGEYPYTLLGDDELSSDIARIGVEFFWGSGDSSALVFPGG